MWFLRASSLASCLMHCSGIFRYLDGNVGLGGPFPATWSTPEGMQSLEKLSIEGCSFTGPLPADLGANDTLTNLTFFSFGGNDFTGSLPASWAAPRRLSKLVEMYALTGYCATCSSYWSYWQAYNSTECTGGSFRDGQNLNQPCDIW